MRRFLAMVKKEFRQIARDKLSLGLLIFVPVMLLTLYGYALSFDVKHIRVAVVDHDRTEASRRFLDSLFQNPYFTRGPDLESERDADELLQHNRARVVMVVPEGYAVALARGGEVAVQMLVDAANANTASTAIGYLEAVADRATRQAREEWKSRQRTEITLPQVAPEPRMWFNPELKSATFLVPGLIGMIMMLSAVVATALSIVREKERETMEQLQVSPIRPEELVLGKTLPYVVIGLVSMALILGLAYLLFGVQVRGSFFLLGFTALLFLFAALGLGVFISSVTKSQQVAFQVAILTSLLPSIILSGLIFPISNMPWPIQGLTFVVIPSYFVAALRGIILKGAGLAELWPQLLGLLVLGLVFNLLAAHNTRKAA